MPPLTRWFLKTALIYLVSALAVGALLALRNLISLPAALVGLSPVYFHWLMVGWVTQLIFGVVFWMFPKHSSAHPRGSEALGWATYGLLNAGLVLRSVGEPWMSAAAGTLPGSLLALSAVLQWLAGMAFVVNTWGRVKER
jgi:hypothetical protein